MLNKFKLQGFTLVEMVVTLTITLGLAGLGALKINEYREKLILENTVKEIKSSIEHAARRSAIQNRTSIVRYYPSLKEIIITGGKRPQIIKIEPQISISNLSLLKISISGSLPPHTITVSNHQDTRRVKLQMTWGRAIDDK
ncbi:pilus assembly FimT family protein [Lactobacillus kimbladii]|uniref:pilus assembly FimT family protein n=1 Tax=Lactobacillus kimbladii TaxID=1218506 RepID=UPI003AF59E19